MTTRDPFAGHSAEVPAAIAFTGCDLLDAARARRRTRAASASRATRRAREARRRRARRRQVMVGGRRVRTIDVHAHCIIPEAHALLGLQASDHRGPGIEEVGARRMREMDAQGIDIEAISINPAGTAPSVTCAPRRWSRSRTRRSQASARRTRTASSRSPRWRCSTRTWRCSSSRTAMKELGLRGAAVGASVAGQEFADPKFHPFWAKAEELGA